MSNLTTPLLHYALPYRTSSELSPTLLQLLPMFHYRRHFFTFLLILYIWYIFSFEIKRSANCSQEVPVLFYETNEYLSPLQVDLYFLCIFLSSLPPSFKSLAPFFSFILSY
jgi:hypothetical protein